MTPRARAQNLKQHGQKGEKNPVSSDGPVNECLNQFEEPECCCGKEDEEETACFGTLNSDELTATVANSEAKGTKRNRKWCLTPLIVFDGMVLSEELPIKCHTN